MNLDKAAYIIASIALVVSVIALFEKSYSGFHEACEAVGGQPYEAVCFRKEVMFMPPVK